MNIATARSTARTRCREGLSAVLKELPAGLFSAARDTFPSLPEASLHHRVQRRVLEVLRHRGLPGDAETFALVDNPEIRMVNAESFAVERLYWFGQKNGYEPEVVVWWREYCRRATRILELGANIGYFTVQGAKAAGTVPYVAVEPHPGCAAVCRENVRINGINNVEVIEAAALDSVDSPTVTLLMPGLKYRDRYVQAPCTGFVGRNEMHTDDSEDPSYGSYAVRAVRLSDLVEDVDLVKMDVEGQEFALLASVADLIRAARPTLFLELLDGTPNLRRFVADLCSGTDYRCYIPTKERLIPIAAPDIGSVSLSSAYGTRDVILTCRPVPEGPSVRSSGAGSPA